MNDPQTPTLFTAEEIANTVLMEPRPDLFVVVAFSPRYGWSARPGYCFSEEDAQEWANDLSKIWIRKTIFKIPGDPQ